MSDDTHFDVVERLVPELEAEGYEVFVHPKKPLVPKFLENFAPDVVAKRPGKNLVVEVVRPSTDSALKLKQLAALFQNQPDWELRVVWISPSGEERAPEVQDPETVRKRLQEIQDLAARGHNEPALLLAWATFEALARAVSSERASRPNGPHRIVQDLASEGHLTPTEADLARMMADKRNCLIHGDLRVRVSVDDLIGFSSIMEMLLGEIETRVAG